MTVFAKEVYEMSKSEVASLHVRLVFLNFSPYSPTPPLPAP